MLVIRHSITAWNSNLCEDRDCAENFNFPLDAIAQSYTLVHASARDRRCNPGRMDRAAQAPRRCQQSSRQWVSTMDLGNRLFLGILAVRCGVQLRFSPFRECLPGFFGCQLPPISRCVGDPQLHAGSLSVLKLGSASLAGFFASCHGAISIIHPNRFQLALDFCEHVNYCCAHRIAAWFGCRREQTTRFSTALPCRERTCFRRPNLAGSGFFSFAESEASQTA